MFISRFQISNYKSFLSSAEMLFTPGFNVIVGQNNVGKTALVEALSLSFTHHPHRSLKTLPQRNSAYNQTSKCYVSFQLTPGEASALLKESGDFFVPLKKAPNTDSGIEQFREALLHNQLLKCIFQPDTFISADFEHYGEYDSTENFIRLRSDITTGNFELSDTSIYGIPNAASTYGGLLANSLRSKVYTFRAERLNIGQYSVGNNSILAPNAANLAEVLNLLQSSNVSRFRRFNELVSTIFPDIKQITVPPVGNNNVRILIWSVDSDTERDDLAVPLSESGTGIGQVLAMLYVVLTSNEPRTIIIDEPQSFLNSGAVRKLLEILKLHSQHQFIITTHSPTAVTAIDPKTLLLIRKSESESLTETINVLETRELRIFLSEVGARLSDVFGADNILWVEGRTEELCFPLIVEKIIKQPLLGTQIIGVQHTGDFESRHSKTVFEIYTRLSEGCGLLPGAIGFIFDREDRSQKEREDLERQSNGKVFFLKRKMYENYLLNSDAMSFVLSQADSSGLTSVTPEDVLNWLQSNGHDKRYIQAYAAAPLTLEWQENVHGARILEGLFSSLSENRVSFDKVKHGVELTEWIVNNSPRDLDELTDLIRNVLAQKNP